MAMSKLRINLVFGCIVVALALIAVTSLYFNTTKHEVRPAASEAPSDKSLPENHPSIDTANTLAALEKMSAADPQNPDYQTQIANLYYDLGQYEKAIGFYQKSLSLRPRDPNVETDLAVCFHYLGQDDRALETLDKVLQYTPGFSQAMFNKGTILIDAKKDIRGGIKVWEDLLRLNPDYPQKAQIEQRINQFKDAIK
jgi:tetratricopeptide (TPR) repeat protein